MLGLRLQTHHNHNALLPPDNVALMDDAEHEVVAAVDSLPALYRCFVASAMAAEDNFADEAVPGMDVAAVAVDNAVRRTVHSADNSPD